MADARIQLLRPAQFPELIERARRSPRLRTNHNFHAAEDNQHRFLNVMIRYVEHIDRTFGRNPGQKRGYCGHEEIELGLVKLYQATNEKKYLDLAKFFLDARGRSDKRKLFGEYAQDHKPVREQTEVPSSVAPIRVVPW